MSLLQRLRLLLALAGSALTTSTLAEGAPEEIVVRTRASAELQGSELIAQGAVACLRTRRDGGVVEVRIAKEDIDEIVFPPVHSPDDATSRERRLRNQLPWVRWLPASDRAGLLAWTRSLAEQAPASEALAVLDQLTERWPPEDDCKRELRRLAGDVCARLRWTDRTLAAALAWCREPPEAGEEGAWGWWRLAEDHWRHGRVEEASWNALRPIALGVSEEAPGLAECYAYAIAAARRAGRTDHAKALDDERSARNLPWPALPELEAWKRTSPVGPQPSHTAPEGHTSPAAQESEAAPVASVETARRLILPNNP